MEVFLAILLTALWIIYGTMSAYQYCEWEGKHQPWIYILMCIFSPVILALRIVAGVFGRRAFITPEYVKKNGLTVNN